MRGVQFGNNTQAANASVGRQLGKNLAQAGKNSVHNLVQQPAQFKRNSLIIAMAILVVSRMAVAHQSARKAKGTPDYALRYREAIRTDIREVLGWTFGYIVLRAIEMANKAGLRKAFDLQKETGGKFGESAVTQMRRSVGAAMNGKADYKVPGPELVPTGKNGIALDNLSETAKTRIERYKQLVGKLPELPGIKTLQKKSGKELMKWSYRWAPIAIGSIPAIGLAGVWLEKFTREDGDKVAEMVSKHFGGRDDTNPESGAKIGDDEVSGTQPAQQQQIPAAQPLPQQPVRNSMYGPSGGSTGFPDIPPPQALSARPAN